MSREKLEQTKRAAWFKGWDILIYALHIFLRLKSDGFVAVIVVIGANASGGYDKFVSIF